MRAAFSVSGVGERGCSFESPCSICFGLVVVVEEEEETDRSFTSDDGQSDDRAEEVAPRITGLLVLAVDSDCDVDAGLGNRAFPSSSFSRRRSAWISMSESVFGSSLGGPRLIWCQ